MTLGCKDKGVIQSKLVAKAQCNRGIFLTIDANKRNKFLNKQSCF